MLVLSRRLNQKVLFPSLNISVQVAAIKSGVVRLGITAPPEVAVVREEVHDRQTAAGSPGRDVASGLSLRDLSHLVRTRVNIANTGLALARGQLRAGQGDEAVATIEEVERELQMLQQRVEEEVHKPAPPPRKHRKVLVVEDDRTQCELLAGFLRLAGLEVVTAGDGADALDYLRQRDRPDCVLLDMVMPRCDGATMVRVLRGDRRYDNLKIFALTGHTPEHLAIDPRTAGIDRWFHKPVDPEVLLHDLDQELARGG